MAPQDLMAFSRALLLPRRLHEVSWSSTALVIRVGTSNCSCDALSARHQRPVGAAKPNPEPRVLGWMRSGAPRDMAISVLTPERSRRTSHSCRTDPGASTWKRGSLPTFRSSLDACLVWIPTS